MVLALHRNVAPEFAANAIGNADDHTDVRQLEVVVERCASTRTRSSTYNAWQALMIVKSLQ